MNSYEFILTTDTDAEELEAITEACYKAFVLDDMYGKDECLVGAKNGKVYIFACLQRVCWENAMHSALANAKKIGVKVTSIIIDPAAINTA